MQAAAQSSSTFCHWCKGLPHGRVSLAYMLACILVLLFVVWLLSGKLLVFQVCVYQNVIDK